MIYDLAAFVGHYERRPVGVEAEFLAGQLKGWGVARVFASRIDVLRMENCHAAKSPQKAQVYQGTEVIPVPVIDPSLPGWQEYAESFYAAQGRRLKLLRLHPNYHGYSLTDRKLTGPLVEWAHFHGCVIQVVVNVDDVRRQHPLGQVPDVPAADVVNLCKVYPHQQFLLSGAFFTPLQAIAKNRPANLWADTARIETGDGLPLLVQAGWLERLVFASHAPILIPYSAVARILADLNDADSERIFTSNSRKLLDLS